MQWTVIVQCNPYNWGEREQVPHGAVSAFAFSLFIRRCYVIIPLIDLDQIERLK